MNLDIKIKIFSGCGIFPGQLLIREGAFDWGRRSFRKSLVPLVAMLPSALSAPTDFIISANMILIKVDAVIVTTVMFFDELKEQLKKKLGCPIIMLEDILNEI